MFPRYISLLFHWNIQIFECPLGITFMFYWNIQFSNVPSALFSCSIGTFNFRMFPRHYFHVLLEHSIFECSLGIVFMFYWNIQFSNVLSALFSSSIGTFNFRMFPRHYFHVLLQHSIFECSLGIASIFWYHNESHPSLLASPVLKALYTTATVFTASSDCCVKNKINTKRKRIKRNISC